MAIINMSDLFPVRKSFTDIVSYATDEFGCVQSFTVDLAVDVECGDLITSDGAEYVSGGDVLVVVSDAVSAGDAKTVNVLRSNAGLVCIKSDALNEAAIAALAAKGFQMAGFNTVFTS